MTFFSFGSVDFFCSEAAGGVTNRRNVGLASSFFLGGSSVVDLGGDTLSNASSSSRTSPIFERDADPRRRSIGLAKGLFFSNVV